MNCPKCDHEKNLVLEARPSTLRAEWTQRRRKCSACGHRWNTVEVPMSDVIGTEEIRNE
jgi:transcriptional regulator NrdR family protein